jgi:hypothetical protein
MEGYCGSAHDGEWSPRQQRAPWSLPPEEASNDPLCWAEALDPAPAGAEVLTEPARRAAERMFGSTRSSAGSRFAR